eukprot:jgi/Ulvmu1/11142/UM071_0026.1
MYCRFRWARIQRGRLSNHAAPRGACLGWQAPMHRECKWQPSERSHLNAMSRACAVTIKSPTSIDVYNTSLRIIAVWSCSGPDTGALDHLARCTMRAPRALPCTTAQLCASRSSIRFPGQNRVAVAHAAGQTSEATQHEVSAVSLDFVRTQLIRQEDSIIFSLIERAQFLRNDNVYSPNGVPVPAYKADGQCFTFLEYLLMDTEAVHGRIRRYTSPDEHAFFPDALPAMVLPPTTGPSVLAAGADRINLNAKIMPLYLNTILPGITQPGDDANYGSAATQDVLALQALSKRIHFGKFIAEAKFCADPDTYTALVRGQDAAGLMALLTFPEQEARVVARVAAKAALFGQDIGADGRAQNTSYKVQPELVASLYQDWVMSLTKEVQVQYLLRRLDHKE